MRVANEQQKELRVFWTEVLDKISKEQKFSIEEQGQIYEKAYNWRTGPSAAFCPWGGNSEDYAEYLEAYHMAYHAKPSFRRYFEEGARDGIQYAFDMRTECESRNESDGNN